MDKLKSRKFWMAMVGALAPTVLTLITGQIDPVEAMTATSAIIISYVFGQSYVDGKSAIGSDS